MLGADAPEVARSSRSGSKGNVDEAADDPMGEFIFSHRVRQLRYEVRMAVGLIAVQVAACQSPSSPNRCVNGVDGDGRGPMRSLDLTCLNRGSDIQCQSVIQESGYC